MKFGIATFVTDEGIGPGTLPEAEGLHALDALAEVARARMSG